jgi:hypothetical protein
MGEGDAIGGRVGHQLVKVGEIPVHVSLPERGKS